MDTGRTVTKTVWQYSETLPEETMEFLRGIASDYRRVKNDTYQKYSGIRNVDRLTPVYDIIGEMCHCGLRGQLGLPSTYYSTAVVDAVGDIKSKWGILKRKVREQIAVNGNLSGGDKIYLRTVLKLDRVYADILNHREFKIPEKAQGLDIDIDRLNNLLRRLTRKYMSVPVTDKEDYFSVTPWGYRYKNGSIYIAGRKPRQRVEIPLRDSRTCDRQIRIQLMKDFVKIALPEEAKIKAHPDYTNTVYIHIGSKDMFTLSNGNVYGKGLCALTDPETERLARKNGERRRLLAARRESLEAGDVEKAKNIEANNLGRVKYDRQKERERAKTQAFINAEINRMLEAEKPSEVVITKPMAKSRTEYRSGAVNRKRTRNFHGYIRDRLDYKCRINSVSLREEVPGRTGNECSRCGGAGERKDGEFACRACGLRIPVALNCARNLEKEVTIGSPSLPVRGRAKKEEGGREENACCSGKKE